MSADQISPLRHRTRAAALLRR